VGNISFGGIISTINNLEGSSVVIGGIVVPLSGFGIDGLSWVGLG